MNDSLANLAGQAGIGSSGTEQVTSAFKAAAANAELIDFLAPPEADDELGRLGGFRILKILGHGGMGVVFQGEDPRLGRNVAIKAMLPHLAGSKSSQERFLREAKAAATLEHDHIVPILQVGEDRGVPFIVMPFLHGEPLDERLKRDKILPTVEVLRIGRETAEGLAAAHQHGLIHRDIKPANLWLEGEKARVKILDFGLARAVAGDTGLTQVGTIMGTPQYMAPEQAAGKKDIDHRCDLFSLGCVLYRVATNQLPFKGHNTLEIIAALATEEPTPPADLQSGLPLAVSDLIMRLLAKKPQERPQSAQEVVHAIEAIERQTGTGTAEGALVRSTLQAKKPVLWPWLAGLASMVGVAGVALAAVIAGIVLFWQTPHGTVRIESDDPDVEIVFDKNGPTIKRAEKNPISLRAGEHDILVKRGDFSFETDKLVVKKDEMITLKVELLPGKMQLMRDGAMFATKDMPLAKTFTNRLGMEFALVPKGKSWLGGGGGKMGTVEVAILHDFYMGKYEVTQEEWEKVIGVNSSYFTGLVAGVSKEDQKRFPAERVSWDYAQAFVERLNKAMKEPGWVYRLPKGAEWEYACRGGPMADKAESAFDFYVAKPSNALGPAEANFKPSGLERPCKVGSSPPNRLGLYDMHGNVWEWCEDEMPLDPKDYFHRFDKGPSRRLIRGGCWGDDSDLCRAAAYGTRPPEYGDFGIGLRLALVPVGMRMLKIAGEEKKPAEEPKLPPEFKNGLGMEFVPVPKGKSWLGGSGGRPGTLDGDIPGQVRGHAGGMGEGHKFEPV